MHRARAFDAVKTPVAAPVQVRSIVAESSGWPRLCRPFGRHLAIRVLLIASSDSGDPEVIRCPEGARDEAENGAWRRALHDVRCLGEHVSPGVNEWVGIAFA